MKTVYRYVQLSYISQERAKLVSHEIINPILHFGGVENLLKSWIFGVCELTLNFTYRAHYLFKIDESIRKYADKLVETRRSVYGPLIRLSLLLYRVLRI